MACCRRSGPRSRPRIDGTALAYGNDAVTKGLTARFADLFEREVAVFPVFTGTAANALALACLTPPFGAVLCHQDSHIMTSECGAPEFFSGAKLIGLDGADGKLTPETIAEGTGGLGWQRPQRPAPRGEPQPGQRIGHGLFRSPNSPRSASWSMRAA